MRIRTLGSAALAATLIPLGAAASVPASAATGDGHLRYVALTGDDDFLVYAAKVSNHALHPTSLSSQAEIYALAKTGKPIHIGKALPSPEVISLSRSNLLIVNPFKHHKRVRAWNLANGHHLDIGTNEEVVGATPDGWIALDHGFTDGTHVVARSYAGDIVDYGNPITPGVDYAVTVGPNGFVAYADNFVNDNGEITYTRWSNPGHHRTLLAPGGKNVECDSVSATYAGCIIGGGITRAVTLIALGGNTRMTAGNRCAYQVAVWGSRLAWSIGLTTHGCKTGHVGATATDGTSQVSTQRFNILGMTVAWNRLVTSNKGQRSLVKLAGVRTDAKTLGRASV